MKKVLMLALLFPALLDGADVDKAPQLLPRVATRAEFFKRYGVLEIKNLGLTPDELRNEVKSDVGELCKYSEETIHIVTDAYKQQLKNAKWSDLKLFLSGFVGIMGTAGVCYHMVPYLKLFYLNIRPSDADREHLISLLGLHVSHVCILFSAGQHLSRLQERISVLSGQDFTWDNIGDFSEMKTVLDELEKIRNNS